MGPSGPAAELDAPLDALLTAGFLGRCQECSGMNRRALRLILASLLLGLGCGGKDGLEGNDGPMGPTFATLAVTTSHRRTHHEIN